MSAPAAADLERLLRERLLRERLDTMLAANRGRPIAVRLPNVQELEADDGERHP